MTYRKVLASAMVAALMALASAPTAYASDKKDDGGIRQDNDEATAVGGNGGNGGAAIGVGICLIQIAVVGDAGCPNDGVADASGGDGGNAEALADIN